MNKLITFVSAMLAGISIGLGGFVFLSVDNRIAGALLFTVGLFCVCTFGLNLYTGKVCYALQKNKEYNLNLPIIWLGNLAGTASLAGAIRLTRNVKALSEKAQALCLVKTNDNMLSLFFLGLVCNVLIYIAVEGYNSNKHDLGKYLSLFLGVMVFILTGTEHCVADMFYFWLSGTLSIKALVAILVITAGNTVGGILIASLHKSIK